MLPNSAAVFKQSSSSKHEQQCGKHLVFQNTFADMLSISSLICYCIYIRDIVPFTVNSTTLLFITLPRP